MIHTLFSTPIGPLTIGIEGNRVCFVSSSYKEGNTSAHQTSRQVAADTHPLLSQAVQEFIEYFQGKRKTFTLPLSCKGTPFQKSVWQQLGKIPYGQTMSYGELAQQVGGKNKARAVGGAAHRNPLLILVPCHRLIGSDGSLTGFGSGIAVKKQLLKLEGITGPPTKE